MTDIESYKEILINQRDSALSSRNSYDYYIFCNFLAWNEIEEIEDLELYKKGEKRAIRMHPTYCNERE